MKEGYAKRGIEDINAVRIFSSKGMTGFEELAKFCSEKGNSNSGGVYVNPETMLDGTYYKVGGLPVLVKKENGDLGSCRVTIYTPDYQRETLF